MPSPEEGAMTDVEKVEKFLEGAHVKAALSRLAALLEENR